MKTGHQLVKKTILILLPFVLSACVSTRTITVRESPQAVTWTSATAPKTGHYIVRNPANKTIQETVVKNGRIMASWEYMDYTMTTSEYTEAVESGKVKAFEPYWSETVINGEGIRNLFSPAGKKIGFEDIHDGYVKE